MKVLRDNLALILVALIAVALVFLMLRLQSLLINTQATTPAEPNQVQALPTQQPVVLLPTATPPPPTDTPPPTAIPPTPAPTVLAAEATPTTGGYTLYGSTVIGAIHIGAINDRGYNQANDEGLRQMMGQVPGVRLLSAENVPETEVVLPIIDDMVARGAQIIFTQSFGYLPYALQAGQKYPQVTFVNSGGFDLRENVGTYLANHVEAMYLTGMAAGAATKTNKLGFIIAVPMPSSLASVNAFQLGARSVNPNVTTQVVTTGSWVDPAAEKLGTEALASAGVDVMAMIVDSPITIVETATARGMYVIGFHSGSLQELTTDNWLTGVEHTWGNYFTQVVQQVRNGQWRSGHVRGGIESDMLQLAPFGPTVSPAMQAQILQAREDIIGGRLQIFSGPLIDNQGIERIPAGRVGEPELLDNTDWFVAGVSQFDPTSVVIVPPPNLPVPPATAIPAADIATAMPTVPPAQPTPSADLAIGLNQAYPECRFFTDVITQIMKEKLKLTVDIVPYSEAAPMYEALAKRQQQRTIDMTFCFADPNDRAFLREYFGFIRNVGDLYWRNERMRLQIVTNSGILATLEREQVCLYRLLKNLSFVENELPSQDAAQWLTENQELVDRWASCELLP
ncbi:MAG: BMP family ABC transporter substrate-binding protein [Caldilineaceae bacterium]|nr:BMP family ABC transporter substrate-binding protein [Caldilineaceae bacterium]